MMILEHNLRRLFHLTRDCKHAICGYALGEYSEEWNPGSNPVFSSFSYIGSVDPRGVCYYCRSKLRDDGFKL